MATVSKRTVLKAVDRVFTPEYRGEAKVIVGRTPSALIEILGERYADADISAHGGEGPSEDSLSEAVAVHLFETSD